MKHLLIILIALSFSINLFAQEEETEFTGGSRLGKADRINIDIYSDMWLNAPDSLSIRGYNPGAAANILFRVPFGSSKFSFAGGLGIGTHNLHTDGSLYKDSVGASLFEPFPSTQEYTKNKLVFSYIDVPIEFRFRSTGENVFRISIGGKIGYLINNHNKYVAEGVKSKYFNFDNVNPLRYGLTFRVGWKHYNLFCYYGLSTLFEEGKGPDMVPISFGISLIPL